MRRLFLAGFSTAIIFLATSPAYAVMEDYPSVKLQGLDKSVGRTVTFEAKVGSTIQYGPLYIKIDSCRKAPPIEKPESAAFLQIWEVPPGEKKSEWVFSGWMFASSPALSAMDHPVYDVWVLECTGREEPNEEATAVTPETQADQDALQGSADGAATAPVDSEAEEAVDDPAAAPQEHSPVQEDEPAPAADDMGGGQDDSVSTDPAPAPSDASGVTAYDFMKKPEQNPPVPFVPSQNTP